MNILLVDDRRENLLALQGILQGRGYRLIAAHSGAAALEAVLAQDFAVILLDVSMPNMDGFECATLIKQRPRCSGTPIIFITASIYDLEHIYRGYSVGAVDYLQKPVSPAIVRAKVAVFVELYRQREQIKSQAQLLHEGAQRERELLMIRAEAAVNASEAQYDATTRQATFGAAVLKHDGSWLRINESLCAMLDYQRDGLPPLPELLQASETTGNSLSIQQVLDGSRQTFTGEVRLQQRRGTAMWAFVTLSRLTNDSDSQLALVLEDISERKWSEMRQRFLNQASEVLLSSLDYHATVPHVLSLAVPQFADWCAVDVVQPDGRHAQELSLLHHKVDLLQEVRALRRRLWWDTKYDGPRTPWMQPLLVSEVSQEWLAEHAPHDATDAANGYMPQSLLVVPMTAHGHTLGAITFASEAPNRAFGPGDLRMAEDFAHRCAFAIENTRLYEEAQQAVHARDEFLSVASHELRTPLTPLRIQLQRLIGTPRRAPADLPKERIREILQRSERHVARLGTLVDNLLDVSRITSGRLTLEVESMDLAQMVRDVVARFSEEIANSGSPLSLHADADVRGCWDRSRIEQVVTNLISNAIKYGAGKPIEVQVEQESDGSALLVVRDGGIGIATEKQSLIFERFERAASARAYGGLGLGLFIARQILDAHGATIRVESELGAGSIFRVELPPQAAAHHPAFSQQASAGHH